MKRGAPEGTSLGGPYEASSSTPADLAVLTALLSSSGPNGLVRTLRAPIRPNGAPATDLSFTIDKPELLKAQKVIESLRAEVGFGKVIATENIAKLSIVGVGMKSHSGVAGKMFDTLAREGVNIDMISTSEIKISVVIDLAKGEQAMRAVHGAFLA